VGTTVQGAQGAKGPQGATGAVGPTGPSDQRLKNNVENIQGALDKILNIRGVEFEWKENLGQKNIGFIAQEVLPHIPEVVHWNDRSDIYTMKYKEMIAVSVEALKEQDIRITELESRYERLVRKATERGLI
jgi:hypothetical protein